MAAVLYHLIEVIFPLLLIILLKFSLKTLSLHQDSSTHLKKKKNQANLAIDSSKLFKKNLICTSCTFKFTFIELDLSIEKAERRTLPLHCHLITHYSLCPANTDVWW